MMKVLKVSDKGQISIPAEVRKSIGIERNDSLMLMCQGNRIILEKPEKIIKESFSDLNSEEIARRVWDNEEDEIWNSI